MTMARVLLDSTVLIDALRGRAAAERVAGLRRWGIEPALAGRPVVASDVAALRAFRRYSREEFVRSRACTTGRA